jgi:hypothetical protein
MSNKTQKLFTSRVNNLDANTYIGEAGRLFYDEPITANTAPVLRYSDGVTPGGIPLSTGGGTTSTGHITAQNVYVDRGSDMNDWNAVTTMGVYLINRTSWAGTTNTPLNTMSFSGQLEVINTGNVSITQNYRPYYSTTGKDAYWTRSKYSTNAWTLWVEITNGAETMDGGNF